jgi:MFS family permease
MYPTSSGHFRLILEGRWKVIESSSEGALIIARAAQGAGGAIAAPTALALLATTFTEPTARTCAFGVFAALPARQKAHPALRDSGCR